MHENYIHTRSYADVIEVRFSFVTENKWKQNIYVWALGNTVCYSFVFRCVNGCAFILYGEVGYRYLYFIDSDKRSNCFHVVLLLMQSTFNNFLSKISVINEQILWLKQVVFN